MDYMARCARLICENMARTSGGMMITEEFTDIIHKKPAEERTAQQIIDDVVARAGIEVN